MSSVLAPPDELNIGDSLTSSNGRYQLILQSDGNLVIYDLQENHLAVWSSGTNGKAVSKALMQDDGNFVIYGNPTALNPLNPLWATNTANQPDAFLVLQDDGSLIVVRQIREALWSAGTEGQ
jgi:hypothetical protein